MAKPDSICTCKQCKKNFPAPSKRFSVCSPECQAILDAAYVRPPRPTITLTCQYCTTTVTRKAQRYEFGKYCSRPCAYAGRAITRAAKAAEEKAQREAEKHAQFMAWVAERTAMDAAQQQAKEEADKIRHCVMCCGEYEPPKSQRLRLCSMACRRDYEDLLAVRKRQQKKDNPASRAAKSLTKARRRMVERDAIREKVDPVAVFERDGWRCYMCGVSTPVDLKGSNAPNAPELEHVVSLTDGGEHSMRNLACSCRECNSVKGARSFRTYRVNLEGPQQVLGNPQDRRARHKLCQRIHNENDSRDPIDERSCFHANENDSHTF